MLVFGLNSTAYIANSFAGPAIAQLFQQKSSFRWAFGAFAIIVPFLALPIIGSFLINWKKAKQTGLAPERSISGRTWKESTVYYWREFDGKLQP